MTREQYAEMLLRDVQGLDTTPNEGTRPMSYGFDNDSPEDELFGADDPVKRAGLSTLPIQFTIANLASLNVDLLKVDDLALAALPTGVSSPVVAAYTNIVKYLLANPSRLQSVIIQSNETATGGAPVLSSLRINPKRVTPFGLNSANEIRVQSYQTTQDFQANRVTIPLAVSLDAFTFLNFVSDQNTSGASVVMNVTLMIGRRNESRKNLKGGGPVAMRPGGRGPTAVR